MFGWILGNQEQAGLTLLHGEQILTLALVLRGSPSQCPSSPRWFAASDLQADRVAVRDWRFTSLPAHLASAFRFCLEEMGVQAMLLA